MEQAKKKNIFSRIHDKLAYVFHDSKFGQFWSRAHLQYLALALLMYGFKAVLYFIIAYASNAANAVAFGYINGDIKTSSTIVYAMEIDNAIPFISYFYFFYLLYYILPEIFLWILSFYDNKKMATIVVSTMVTTLLACIGFMIQQVKMLRPEDEMAAYATWSSVHDLDSLFRFGVNWQYGADETALNCLPSLHATVGMAMAMIGLWTGKDEKHFPIALRIFCAIFGFGIIMSTFFVKQHYFIDAVTGAGLMAILYFVFKWWIVPPYLRRREKKLAAKSETAVAAE